MSPEIPINLERKGKVDNIELRYAMEEIKDRLEIEFDMKGLNVKYVDPKKYFGPGGPPNASWWILKRSFGFVNTPVLGVATGFWGGAFGQKEIHSTLNDPRFEDVVQEEIGKYAEKTNSTSVNLEIIESKK